MYQEESIHRTVNGSRISKVVDTMGQMLFLSCDLVKNNRIKKNDTQHNKRI